MRILQLVRVPEGVRARGITTRWEQSAERERRKGGGGSDAFR